MWSRVMSSYETRGLHKPLAIARSHVAMINDACRAFA